MPLGSAGFLPGHAGIMLSPECSFVWNTWVAVVWEQVHAHSHLPALEAYAIDPSVPRAACLAPGMAL